MIVNGFVQIGMCSKHSERVTMDSPWSDGIPCLNMVSYMVSYMVSLMYLKRYGPRITLPCQLSQDQLRKIQHFFSDGKTQVLPWHFRAGRGPQVTSLTSGSVRLSWCLHPGIVVSCCFHGGTPRAGWFRRENPMENPMKIRMIFRGTPIDGNPDGNPDITFLWLALI